MQWDTSSEYIPKDILQEAALLQYAINWSVTCDPRVLTIFMLESQSVIKNGN